MRNCVFWNQIGRKTMELNGKKILIFGMGVSGKGVAKLLSHLDVHSEHV